jgi:hypothetical protein
MMVKCSLQRVKELAIGLVVAGALCVSGEANASVITFSEAGVCNPNFTSSDGNVFAEWVWATGSTGAPSGTGNPGAIAHCHVSSSGGNPGAYEQGHGQLFQGIRISSVSGAPITLTSFDLQGSWLVGLLNDGSGTLYSAGPPAEDDDPVGTWTTQLVGLTSPSIYIYTNGQIGEARLDNIVANVVPLPAALPLYGTGLGLMGLFGWWKRRRAAAA